MAINTTLIEGQKQMREAGRAADNVAESFATGFKNQIAIGIAEKNNIKATADKYMENLGGIENMNLIEPSQRGAVTDFLRTKRDEFSDLSIEYAKNPTSELKDKMDAIKFQFQTVNGQLKTYMDKRKEYLTDRDEGNLQVGGSFDKDNTFFESTYGNPDSSFAIDYETGKISFTGAGGDTRSLEEFGEHTLRNYEGESTASTVFADAKKIKYDGGLFDKGRVSQQFVFKHRAQGADEIQSLIQTDLSGDDSDLGFMQQWSSGNLKDKSLYDGYKANEDGTYDASWMLENNNKQKVLDAMGKFVGNVSEDIYNSSDENPDRVRKRNQENKSNSKGGNKDYGRTGPKGWRSDTLVREDAEKVNNPKNEDIVTYGDDEYEYDESDGYFYDQNGNGYTKKQMYNRMKLPDDLYVESKEVYKAEVGSGSSGLVADDFFGDDDDLAANFNELLPANSPYTIESASILDANYVKIMKNGKLVKKIDINNRSDGSEEEREGYLKEFEEFFENNNVKLNRKEGSVSSEQPTQIKE